MKTWVAAALLSLSAPAIAAGSGEMANVLSNADWSKMETVTVTMREFSFSPSRISLKAGAPTKLVLRNEGKEAHYFVAETFFRSVATRKIQGSDGEVKAPFLTAAEVYAGKTLEWFLVPTKTGTFDLLCTVKGHAEHGMRGTIEVR